MRVLIVCSGNYPEPEKNFPLYQPFINEQIRSVSKHDILFDKYLIIGKGLFGYLSNVNKLRRIIKNTNYDLIHAHFGLSGLLSVFVSPIPVVITFHGSDVNARKNRIFSLLASRLSRANIFVNASLINRIKYKGEPNIIPCGVNIETFYPLNKISVRETLLFDNKKIYILFSGNFNNYIKNYALAKMTLDRIINYDICLVELKNLSPSGVCMYMNAVDLFLMTSISEASPLVIKEAMACNCPIVSTNVGDVENVIGDTDGCFITTYEVDDVVDKIRHAIDFAEKVGRTQGRIRIIDLGLDSESIAKQILEVYKKALN